MSYHSWVVTSGAQPSRVLLIAAGALTQLIGVVCLILALASLPVVADLKSGMSGVFASIVAALAAIVCGTLAWRGRLVPLALAAGLDVGFGIGLPRGGSAIGAMLRILPADDASTAESLIVAAAVLMFIAAILCVLAVPSALKLRAWAREEIARSSAALPVQDPAAPSQFAVGTAPTGAPVQTPDPYAAAPHGSPYAAAQGGSFANRPPMPLPPVDESAPTNERPQISRNPTMVPAAHPNPGDTLRGFGAMRPSRLLPTQIIRTETPRSKPLVIAGVAVTVIAIGIIVITAATGDNAGTTTSAATTSGSGAKTGSGDGSAAAAAVAVAESPSAPGSAGPAVETPADAGAAEPPSLDDFVTRLHSALASAKAADLAPLFHAKAFAFGVEAQDLAEGRDAIVAQLREDLGAPPASGFEVTTKFSHVASDAGVAWLAQELKLGSKTFIVTAVLGLTDNAWSIAALHWAQPMPNDMAYRLARNAELAIPDAIPNTHDDSPLASAMRTAFASKPSFVEARSLRPDAFNFGSASGERLKGGESIKKIFGKLRATIRLHDAVKVGTLGERGGWGVANVDFTDADRDGTEVTQTFRVLAAWVKEDAGWRIVQTQWSNAR